MAQALAGTFQEIQGGKVMVSLFSVLTVIAAVWMIALFLCAIGGEDVAVILGILMTLASVGLLLYRFGELIKFLVGS